MLTYRNTEESVRLLSSLADRGGCLCVAPDRRIDVRRKWVDLPSTFTLRSREETGTERSLATATEVGDRLSHEDMNP